MNFQEEARKGAVEHFARKNPPGEVWRCLHGSWEVPGWSLLCCSPLRAAPLPSITPLPSCQPGPAAGKGGQGCGRGRWLQAPRSVGARMCPSWRYNSSVAMWHPVSMKASFLSSSSLGFHGQVGAKAACLSALKPW